MRLSRRGWTQPRRGRRREPACKWRSAGGTVRRLGSACGAPPDVTDSYKPGAALASSISIPLTGYALTAAGSALALYNLFRPSWWAATMLLILPIGILSLVASSPASFDIGAGRRRTTNGVLILPFVGLLVADMLHRSQVDPWLPLIPAAFCAFAATAAAWGARRAPGVAKPWFLMTFIAAAGGVYGYGAVTTIDVQFDSSPGEVLGEQVLAKHLSYGRRSTHYELLLPPWGSRQTETYVGVNWATFHGVQVGENVCIMLHPGRLALPWFT